MRECQLVRTGFSWAQLSVGSISLSNVNIQVNKEMSQVEDDDADSVDSSENSPSVLGSPPADMSFDSTDLPLYNNVSNELICISYYLTM